ncbi:hypothetical protein MMC07_003035 [Pseudocyphellaria aurata]|nr:hypothetical protein [Pseudocyphellaria aurata]
MGVLSSEEGTGNIPYQLSHLKDTRGPLTITACAVLSALSTLAIILKFLARRQTKARFEADDCTIFVTLVFAWASFVSIYFETRNGLGLHLLAVKPEQIQNLTRALLFEAPTFQIAVMLNQLSILFLYRRVFTLIETWFKHVLYAIGIFCICSGVSLFFAGLFHCIPLSHGWNLEVPGHCSVDIQPLYITATVLNLVGDISIVAAPIPLIWSIRMSLSSKVAVTGMFLLGGFVSIINMIKLHSIIVIPIEDFTWYDVPVAIWTHASLCLGIVSACLPCYQPLFRQAYRKLSTYGSKSSSSAAQIQPKELAAGKSKTSDEKETDTGDSEIRIASRVEWDALSLSHDFSGINTAGTSARQDVEKGFVMTPSR